ncbi:MAG: hypothetical protein U7126_25565 [Microcoleus sp.]
MPLFINNNAKTPEGVYFFLFDQFVFKWSCFFLTNVQGDMGDRIEPQYV